jgi:hypothetical protein
MPATRYSLSMITNKYGALMQAEQLLDPKLGFLW